MAEIIKQRQHKVNHVYALFYPVMGKGWGFSFECDATGKLLPMTPTQQASYDKAVASGVKSELQHCAHRWHEAAILRCNCGAKVELEDAMTNECEKCGQLYNGGGQELVPRDQWEEPWDDE